MASTGDEQRIQALYSELAVLDQNTAPRFQNLWSTPAEQPRTRLRFRLVPIALGVLAVCLSALAIWSLTKRESQTLNNSSANAAAPSSTTTLKKDSGGPSSTSALNHKQRDRRTRRQNQFLAKATKVRNAKSLTSWKSPTQTLMDPPTVSLLTSTPQLNQSVKELQSFLPNNR